MPQGSVSLLPFLLLLTGYAMAGLSLWPSLHVALSNASVFVDYSTERNATDVHNVILSLVDTETNTTLLTRTLPENQSEGRVELNCSCFLYAGTFRFHLRWTSIATTARVNGSGDSSEDTTTYWWSPELLVQWPTFHIAVERAGNHSGSFQVGISTNEHFQGCSSVPNTALFLEVSYMEYNQIGRNSIDKVRVRTRHPIAAVRSQSVQLPCAFPFTEKDFIRVALRSPHTAQEVKSSGPLYLSRIFSYKLLVDNANTYRTGCEGAMTIKLVTPPCAHINGKVLLYQDGGVATGVVGLSGTGAGGTASAGFGSEEPPSPPLAFNWLTQGENETEFNCSVFYPGRNKYCFRFVFNFSRSPSPAQTCLVVHRSTESWGPWLPWSVCSVSCGEGVRERVRECLLPSGAGGLQCTGMVKEQSLCSLEECAVLPHPSPSLPPVAVGGFLLGGNLVAVIGISLCLAVILATILVTVWRKVCQTPPCSSVRRGSMHSPGGRKLSDEASICGHSLQRPSLSDSQGQQGGLEKERLSLACQPLSQPLVVALPQDPERLSPSGQKLLPPIFGYRLAQQQLKEMKKQGLKEATQLYHVSSSPVNDTLLEASASPAHSPAPTTPIAFSASALSASTSVPLDLQEEANLSPFRINAPFPEPRTLMVTSRSTPDRLSPRVELVLVPNVPGFGPGGSSKRHERTADWVEMVERFGGLRGGRSETGIGNPHRGNQNFRRASSFSFNDPKHQPPLSATSRQFRERSMTQVASRTLPEGSCRTKGIRENAHFPSYPIPEQGVSEWPSTKSRPNGNELRKPWVDMAGPCINSQVKHMGTSTAAVSVPDLHTKSILNGTGERARRKSGGNRGGGDSGGAGAGGTSGIGGPPGVDRLLGLDRTERAEQNWSRRGPSPIQRNILARKLKEAQSCAAAPSHMGRQRSSTFSIASPEKRKGRCHSMDYSSSGGSPYGLSEAEQKMMDLDLSYSG